MSRPVLPSPREIMEERYGHVSALMSEQLEAVAKKLRTEFGKGAATVVITPIDAGVATTDKRFKVFWVTVVEQLRVNGYNVESVSDGAWRVSMPSTFR